MFNIRKDKPAKLSEAFYKGLEEYIQSNFSEPFAAASTPESVPKAVKAEAQSMMADAQPMMVGAQPVQSEMQLMPEAMLDMAASVEEEALSEEPSRKIAFGKTKEARSFVQRNGSVKRRSLDEVISQVSETWQESLFRTIDEKGFSDTEVYKRAGVDRKLFSKIRSNANYQPKKATATAFALALKLSLDETKDMLGRAGYALSNSSVSDLIVEYFIENEVYDLYTINLALYEHGQPVFGE